jgi:hypothetical protein
MKIKLKKKDNQYAQVHVNMLRDKTLSLKAKGLGAVLESYSNDFEVSVKSIEIGSNDGVKAIKTAIKELEQGYYLFRFQTHDKEGKFITFWAFDSQKLEVDYLKDMINELEKVELITDNDLLSPGYQNGTTVNDCTGVPFSVGGLSADGKTADGKSTTYNNTNYQNKKDNNNSLSQESEREVFKNLQTFKSHFIAVNTNVPFYTQNIGYEPTTPFKVNESGFIVNLKSSKIISKEEALKIWEYLFNFYQNQKIGA